MKITIELRDAVYGKFNIPCKTKIAMTEKRISVWQHLNDLREENKIDGTVYLKMQKQISKLLKKDDAEGIARVLTLNEIAQIAFNIKSNEKH